MDPDDPRLLNQVRLAYKTGTKHAEPAKIRLKISAENAKNLFNIFGEIILDEFFEMEDEETKVKKVTIYKVDKKEAR